MAFSPTTKFPGYHVCLGLVFLGLGIMAKDSLPPSVGSLPFIQLPCAFFSAVLIPFGSLLALRGLILQSTSRKNLLSFHLLSLILVLVILSLYFYESLLMNSIVNLPVELPKVLPKLIENAKNVPNEQKRMLQAKIAYRLFGVTLAYPLDTQQVVYYVPTADDLAVWHKSEQSTHQAQAQITFIKKVAAQFPYLFGLYAATFTATFSAGWIWLMLKLPKDSLPPTS